MKKSAELVTPSLIDPAEREVFIERDALSQER